MVLPNNKQTNNTSAPFEVAEFVRPDIRHDKGTATADMIFPNGKKIRTISHSRAVEEEKPLSAVESAAFTFPTDTKKSENKCKVFPKKESKKIQRKIQISRGEQVDKYIDKARERGENIQNIVVRRFAKDQSNR